MEQLNQAIAEVKAGNKGTSKQLLAEIVRTDPQNEAAWLWLSVCVDSIDQKKYCLTKALSINPANQNAKKALEQLQPLPQPSLEEMSEAQKTPEKPKESDLSSIRDTPISTKSTQLSVQRKQESSKTQSRRGMSQGGKNTRTTTLIIFSTISVFVIIGIVIIFLVMTNTLGTKRAQDIPTQIAINSISSTSTSDPANKLSPINTQTPTNTFIQTDTLTPTSTGTHTPTSTPRPTNTSTATYSSTPTPLPPMTQTAMAKVASQTSVAANATATRQAYYSQRTATSVAKAAQATEIAQYQVIPWNTLESYPDKYIGQKIILQGQVVEVGQHKYKRSEKTIEIAVSFPYEFVYVTMRKPFSDIFVWDWITVYGTWQGCDGEACILYAMDDAFYVK